MNTLKNENTWRPEKSQRSSNADSRDQRVSTEYDDSGDVGIFARGTNNGSATLDELRGQGGFGVVVAASEMKQPPPTNTPSIGSRFTTELDSLSRRECQVREIQELATHRVIDLTTEQLRQILEFMM